MSKNLDTSWFDLNNYEALKTMSLEEWIHQIRWRLDFDKINLKLVNGHDALRYISCFPQEIMKDISLADGDELKNPLSQAAILKTGVVPYIPRCHERRVSEVEEKHPFNTVSVNNISAGDFWNKAKNNTLDNACKIHKFYYDVLHSGIEYAENKETLVSEIEMQPFDFILKNYSTNAKNEANLVINLDATNEQIKNDFNHWLVNYRNQTNDETKKTIFIQSDFDHWIKYGAIPYLDVMLIAKIEGKKITQSKLAWLIFPDEINIDIVGRLRQVTRPIAEMLEKYETISALLIQLGHEKIVMKNA